MESTTLTFPHTVGRHDVLTHVSRSALSNYPSPFCSHIAFRMAPGDMGNSAGAKWNVTSAGGEQLAPVTPPAPPPSPRR